MQAPAGCSALEVKSQTVSLFYNIECQVLWSVLIHSCRHADALACGDQLRMAHVCRSTHGRQTFGPAHSKSQISLSALCQSNFLVLLHVSSRRIPAM